MLRGPDRARAAGAHPTLAAMQKNALPSRPLLRCFAWQVYPKRSDRTSWGRKAITCSSSRQVKWNCQSGRLVKTMASHRRTKTIPSAAPISSPWGGRVRAAGNHRLGLQSDSPYAAQAGMRLLTISCRRRAAGLPFIRVMASSSGDRRWRDGVVHAGR